MGLAASAAALGPDKTAAGHEQPTAPSLPETTERKPPPRQVDFHLNLERGRHLALNMSHQNEPIAAREDALTKALEAVNPPPPKPVRQAATAATAPLPALPSAISEKAAPTKAERQARAVGLAASTAEFKADKAAAKREQATAPPKPQPAVKPFAPGVVLPADVAAEFARHPDNAQWAAAYLEEIWAEPPHRPTCTATFNAWGDHVSRPLRDRTFAALRAWFDCSGQTTIEAWIVTVPRLSGAMQAAVQRPKNQVSRPNRDRDELGL